ncbi:uncharacterized protein CLUP02_11119 [Colletotrichum lupini]|uniref:Uncharacterized protein n=1 Tax=Colletotrichum lupini TaxID=145971 RepID=A0A9Q8SY84_9PEZI|nr:uncharacterized protein CLUP02_11119 [Colletotrichum lupini]UQC85620.1 hypothetical protein CLUP02_11119 [Colletotrichum lupini]
MVKNSVTAPRKHPKTNTESTGDVLNSLADVVYNSTVIEYLPLLALVQTVRCLPDG